MNDQIGNQLANGEISIDISSSPVSIQARKEKRDLLIDEIRSKTKLCNELIVGDVQVLVEWYIHERKRYEEDSSADTDNIIKPLLDGLCGPEGLIIDDCQVQAIDCRWIDWTLNEESINITIKFFPDEILPKNALVFIGLDNTLYLPINYNLPIEPLTIIVNSLEKAFAFRNELLAANVDYYSARGTMPIFRPFHITRLRNFNKMSIQEFKTRCLIANIIRNKMI